MKRRVQLISFVVFAFVAIQAVGCTSLQSHPKPSATGGLEMTLFVRDETRSESFYQVTTDGSLSWAGGMAARLHSPKWTGPMTEDEIAQLRALLAARNYFRAKPPSTQVPEDHIYRVSINSPEHRTRFTVKGMSAEIEPIRELLATASLRRLEEDLNRLPLPSSQNVREDNQEQK